MRQMNHLPHGQPAAQPSAQPAGLPAPHPEEVARSQALLAVLAKQIEAANGFLRFDHFMRAVLYTPQLGYYSGPAAVFGSAGDFVTAPQLSPIFAACLAEQLRRWLGSFTLNERCLTEFGAGDGTLAAQLLALLGDEIAQYDIIELSANLQARQRAQIAQLAPAQLSKVRWLTQLPEQLNGVVFGNELLDAMPVRLFELQTEQNDLIVVERGVGFAHGALHWQTQCADPSFNLTIRKQLSDAVQGAQLAQQFDSGYTSEYAEEAQGWIASVATRLQRGVLLLIDYGFGASEFYLPQRSGGTLMCHYRHHAHTDPLALVGLQDVTSHVDFSAVTQTAIEQGLFLLGYTTQARFLMNNQLGEIASQMLAQSKDFKDRINRTQGLQKLVSEAEMGELFKVLALAKGGDFDVSGFNPGDRSNRL
jgi:SAM-dependent MidA family methyltransferase